MSLRLFVDTPLAAGLDLALPADAARHVQVRRLQPGDALTLFDGRGGEWSARVARMGRRDVDVTLLAHEPLERGLAPRLEIALGMPANERMDDLVEKATELGVVAIQPLTTERSVLRLDGERAAKRVAHWQAVAIGAAQQSGRTRVPVVRPVATLPAWLAANGAGDARRVVLSTGDAPPLRAQVAGGVTDAADWCALSGPEGGLAPDEEAAAVAAGFARISLGPLVLRADTAPLAWLAQMAVLA